MTPLPYPPAPVMARAALGILAFAAAIGATIAPAPYHVAWVPLAIVGAWGLGAFLPD